MLQWIVVVSAYAEEDTECDFDVPSASVAWAAPEGGDLLVTSGDGADGGAQWTVRVEARFGARSHTWEVGPVTADARGAARLALSPPTDALLDPLATSYVTDLSVRVVGVREDGATTVLVAPPAWLSWSSSGTPTVWSAEGLAAHAPQGVTDPALVPAGLPAGARVLPPTFRVSVVSEVNP